jgi:putative hydrolase of the HAD superfamily
VITAVVVDLDGVLRTWEKRSFAVLEATYGLPGGSMAAVAFDAARLLPAITGRVPDEEWRAGTSAELVARYGPGGALAVEAWSRDAGELVPEVVELVARQRPGRTVAVLTNATTRLADHLDVLGLGDSVDVVFNSAEIGVAKPDPAVFTLVCRRLGVDPQDCALIDDSPANTSAAAALGMTTHLYRTPAGLEAFLAGLGAGRAGRRSRVHPLTGSGSQTAVTDTNRYADSFRLLDADGDGKVSATELIQMMRNLGESVTEEAARRAVEIMDSDGDGLVSLEEFSTFQWAHDA